MPATIFFDAGEYDEEVTKLLHKVIDEKINATGSCIVALSGGSTPSGIYKLLPNADIEWKRVYFIQVDERWVQVTSPQSNAMMIFRAFNSRIPNFFPMPTLAEPPFISSETYESFLKGLLAKLNKEAIDVSILGMGLDGHSASIFPDIPDLGNYLEKLGDRMVAVHYVPSQQATRITLTPRFLSKTLKSFALIRGSGKGKVLSEALTSHDVYRYPVLMCTGKDHVWVLDEEARQAMIN